MPGPIVELMLIFLRNPKTIETPSIVYHHKEHLSRASELLELLNGYRPVNLDDEVDDGMRPWGHSDLEYLFANNKKEDKVVKWILPTQVDGLTGDVFVNFPDDLLEAANLKEGDKIQWVDQGDGSYLLRKVEI